MTVDFVAGLALLAAAADAALFERDTMSDAFSLLHGITHGAESVPQLPHKQIGIVPDCKSSCHSNGTYLLVTDLHSNNTHQADRVAVFPLILNSHSFSTLIDEQ